MLVWSLGRRVIIDSGGARGNFLGDRNVLYLNLGGGYVGV